MQEIRCSNPLVVTGICDPNKSRARHHRSLKLGSKFEVSQIFRFSDFSVNTFLGIIIRILIPVNGDKTVLDTSLIMDLPKKFGLSRL